MNKTRVKSTAVWSLQILIALLFLMQAWNKLASMPAWVEMFRKYGYPHNFYLVIGFLEGIGAVALLIPRTIVYSTLLLGAIMIGATITHLLNGESAIATLIILVLLGTIAFARRGNFARLRRREFIQKA